MAGVNMRLKTGGVREQHCHKQAEWSIMLAGNARITAVDNDGKNFIADVGASDLWYFPADVPHSIQGLGPDGGEFLLAFPDGAFSESSTFLLSEVFARTPKDVSRKTSACPRMHSIAFRRSSCSSSRRPCRDQSKTTPSQARKEPCHAA
jgi:oxalate decarboxylase